MIKKITIGKYIPGDSILHRLDTRSKILISIVVTTLSFYIKNVFLLAFVFLICSLGIKLSGVKISKFLKSNLPLLLFSLLTTLMGIIFEIHSNLITKGQFFVSQKCVENSAMVFFRLMSLVFTASALMFTTSPSEISFAIEKILKPLNLIGLNSRDIALTITITLRFIPTVFEQANKILNAQKSRGATFKNKNILKTIKTLFSVLIPLLVSSVNRADDLATALESRCYDSQKPRTKLKTSKFKKEDYIAFLILGLFILGVILCKTILGI